LGFSESIQSKIYWAGEATHSQGHHGTLHGAMETAAIAVEKIMKEEKA
jgi:monoamine oxidase